MPSYNYEKLIKSLLLEGPKLSSFITDSLVDKFNVRKSTARKNLNRLSQKGVIFDSRPLKFLGNEYGYSLKGGSDQYIKLLNEKPKLYNLYILFSSHRIVPINEMLKIGGLLNKKDTKYYDIDKAEKDLKFFFKDFHSFKYNGTIFYTVYNDNLNIQSHYDELLKARKVEVDIIPFVLSYCMKINLISKKPWYISKDDPFGFIETRQNLAFDATAFTNVGNPNKEKSICVFDFNVNSPYTKSRLDGFRYRFETLINATRHLKQRVIPIVVYNEMDYWIENEISKYNNIIRLKLSTIFGSRINSFLEILKTSKIEKLSDAQEILDIVEKSDYADQLTRFFPFVFETIINELLNRLFERKYNYTTSKTIRLKNGDYKEFDGWFESDDEIILVESKFYKKNMIKWEERTKKDKLKNTCAKYFFVDKTSFILRWQSENNDKRELKAIFVSANGFWKDVHENIEQINISYVTPQVPLIITATELLEKCKAKGIAVTPHNEWLNRYYIRKNLQIHIDEDEENNETADDYLVIEEFDL
jgi:hypothetical protein